MMAVENRPTATDAETIAEREYDHLRPLVAAALAAYPEEGRRHLEKLQSYYRGLLRHELSDRRAQRLKDRLDDLKLLEQKTRPKTRVGDEPGPTPETAAKHRQQRDPIEVLASKGSLTRAQHRAAIDVRNVYHALTKALLPGARDLSDVQPGKQKRGAKKTREPADQMPDRLLQAERRIYTPWRKWLEAESVAAIAQRSDPSVKPTRQSRQVAALPVVMDVLIDGQGLQATDRAHGLRNGLTAQALRAALDDYARRTGLESDPSCG
jgi:hypothetical protein